jgi:hypothetical protein
MKRLIKGYENRVKEFISKMIDTPIIIRNNKDKQMTTREELYATSSDKILDKKGFVFKSYKSDKERINEITKNKEYIEKILSKNREKLKKQEFDQKLKQINYFQPSMRFKKRTDLEQIYDLLKKKENLNPEQKVIYNELLKMGLIHENVIKYNKEDEEYEKNNLEKNFNSTDNIFYQRSNYLLNNDSMNNEEKFKKILHDKILIERKNMLIKRKAILEFGNKIKKINNEKKIKTNDEDIQKSHFKAMENVALFKASTVDRKLFKVWSLQDLVCQHNIKESKKIFYKTITSNFPKFDKKEKNDFKKKSKKNINININNINNADQIIPIENNNNINMNIRNENEKLNSKKFNEYNVRKKNEFDFNNEEKIIKDLELKKEIMSTNPLLFKLYFRNYKNNNIDFNNHFRSNLFKNSFSYEQTKKIKEIAFKNKEIYNLSNSKDRDNYYEGIKKEENVLIDGKFYPKSEADIIARKVLKKCNWNNYKKKHKNTEGRGKLMFTNGLTVKEFEIKYGLLP